MLKFWARSGDGRKGLLEVEKGVLMIYVPSISETEFLFFLTIMSTPTLYKRVV